MSAGKVREGRKRNAFGGRGPVQGDPAKDQAGTVRRAPDGTWLAILLPSDPSPFRWHVQDEHGAGGYERPERVEHWPVVGVVKCDPSTCALASIWAEDVAEVLDAARAVHPDQEADDGWTPLEDAADRLQALVVQHCGDEGDLSGLLGADTGPAYDAISSLMHVAAQVVTALDARSVPGQQDDEPPRRTVVEPVSDAALTALITEALAWEDSPVADHPQRAAIGDFLTGWLSGAEHRVVDARTWQRIQEAARPVPTTRCAHCRGISAHSIACPIPTGGDGPRIPLEPLTDQQDGGTTDA